MALSDLIYRLVKGSPLTPAEGDANLATLADEIELMRDKIASQINDDGTLKDNSVSTAALQDRSVTRAKLDFTANHYYADAGAENALFIDPSPTLGAYAAGIGFLVKVAVTNTGVSTLKVNTLATVTIKKEGNVDVAAGDLKAGQIVELCHDGTYFQLVNTFSFTSKLPSVSRTAYATVPSVSQSVSLAHTLNDVPDQVYVFLRLKDGQTDLGYESGTRVLIASSVDINGDNESFSIEVKTNAVWIHYRKPTGTTEIRIVRISDLAVTAIDRTKWEFGAICIKFPQ